MADSPQLGCLADTGYGAHIKRETKMIPDENENDNLLHNALHFLIANSKQAFRKATEKILGRNWKIKSFESKKMGNFLLGHSTSDPSRQLSN